MYVRYCIIATRQPARDRLAENQPALGLRSRVSHISLDLNVRGCVKFDSILMRNVTKIGVSSSFGVLGSIKQKLIFLTQNQLHKVIFLESDKT